VGRRAIAELGEELRRARVAAGLSQGEVGRALGTSHATVGRIERGAQPGISIVLLSRALAVVGLRLGARAFPDGSPLRDQAHAALLEQLRVRLHPSLNWATEVPFPNLGDRRAWDAVIGIVRSRIGVEAETRARDGQELERRLALKRRDGGVDATILLLSDTRNNRAFVKERRASLADSFPISQAAALAALSAGRAMDGNAIILL
jgi:transcriptional regulator with XRE-family HTH domain